MSDGFNSNLIMEKNGQDYVEVRINPLEAIIRKVIMFGDSDSEIRGFQFFDKDGLKLLEAGKFSCDIKKEVILQEKERLVGVKSNLRGDAPRQNDF